MDTLPRVTNQAGIGGAELPQLGALARYVQDAIGQDGAPVKAVAGVAANGSIKIDDYTDVAAGDTVTIGETVFEFTDDEEGIEIGDSNETTRDNLLEAIEATQDELGIIATASSTDTIAITAAATGVAGNSIALEVESASSGLSRVALSGGVDRVLGTAAPAGAIRTDGADAWIALTATTVDDTSGWRKLTVGGGL